jgi:hypothetical protein
MKLTKALVVASVLFFWSLTGCIGTEIDEPADELIEPTDELTEPADELIEPADELTEPADELTEPAEEDSQQVTPQTTCIPIPGAIAVRPGLTCSHFGFPFNHYKPHYDSCMLLYCSVAGAWSYKIVSIDGCTAVEDLLCS